MEASTTRRIDVGRVLSETFSIYGANAAPLLGSALVVFLVVGIIQGVLTDEGGIVLQLLASVVSLTGTALYTGFVVKLVEDVRDGRRDMTAGQLLSAASPSIVALIVNGFLRAIAITIGFILLVVPGLYLLTIWSVTSPAIVAERRGIMDAFGRSHELVKGEGWSVFGAIVVVALITIAAGAIIAGIGGAIGGVGGLVIAAVIVSVLAAPISALVAAVIFFDLGGGAGATTPEAAAPPPPPPAPAV